MCDLCKKKNIKLYFAHSLNHRKEYREIELDLESKYDVELINPFYDRDRDDIENIDNGNTTRWELPLENCKNIVSRDLASVKESDGFFTIINKPSIGTTLEMGYAKQLGKPIVVVSEIYKDHPWIRVYADHKFANIDEFEDWLKNRRFC